MRKRIFSRICLVAVVCLSLVISATSLYRHFTTTADQTNQINILEEYDQNYEFVIPERKITINGQSVDAQGVLVFPDKSARYDKKIKLSQAGKYTLRYVASLNGSVKVEEYNFIVRQDAVSSENGSTVEYCDFVFDGEVKTQGLQVKLARNDTITFNQLIDVQNLTVDDILLEGFATPQSVGTADMDKLIFTFTDSKNPEIYLTVSNRRYANDSIVGHSYYLAGGNGQSMMGIEASSGKIHVDNIYGTWSNHGYTGEFYSYANNQTSVVSPSDYPFRVSFDTNSMEVYGDTGFIIDLDNTEYFERLWGGFPSGKAKLSISATGYNTSTADFFITKVRGIDLSIEKCVDEKAPDILIDSNSLNEKGEAPFAEIGKGYKIPNAVANDSENGEVDVNVSVWYNYSSANSSCINIINGEFIPTKRGNYTVVYTAEDYMGNVATKLLLIRAFDKVDELVLTLSDDLPQTAVLGEDVLLPDLKQITGGCGSEKVRIFAKNNSSSFEIFDNFACFEVEGEYTITYEVTDYVGNKASKSFNLAVTRGDKPILKEDINLPNLYVSGYDYKLPEVYLNDYSSGSLSRVLCQVKVTDANGEKSYTAGDTFKPTVSENKDKITIVYCYNGVEYCREEIPVIVPIKDGGVILENYFFGEGMTAEKSENGMIITANQSAEEFSWVFANTLISEAFSVEVENIYGYSQFEKITFTLEDLIEPSVSVSVAIIWKNDATFIEICGREYSISYDFSKQILEGDTNVLALSYKNGVITFGKTKIDVAKTDDGEEFNGFPSGKISLKCLTEGVSGDAGYKIVSLNEHKFVKTTRDRVSPQFLITDVYGGSYALNEKYKIPRVLVSDVLCPNTEVKMTVTYNGEVVKSVDGIALDGVNADVVYEILLANYGAYEISYTYKEVGSLRENDNSFVYVVNVEDREKPTITFKQEFKTSIKVGEYLIIPDYVLADNQTSEDKILVIKQVINPNGNVFSLTGNSLKCFYAGVYKVRIFVLDEVGNTTVYSVDVTVSE